MTILRKLGVEETMLKLVEQNYLQLISYLMIEKTN